MLANFQEMRMLSDEVDRGIIYKDQTGFYNFQKLEGILKMNGLINPNYQALFSRLKRQTGLSDENHKQMVENAHSKLEQLAGREFSAEETSSIKRELEDCFIKPAYEDVAAWFGWTKTISAQNDFSPIGISDGWIVVYRPNLQGLQLKKRTGDKFISILGPRFGFEHSQPEPVFELYAEIDGKVFVNQYATYQQVMLEVRNKYLEEIPLEMEIEKSIEKAKV